MTTLEDNELYENIYLYMKKKFDLKPCINMNMNMNICCNNSDLLTIK